MANQATYCTVCGLYLGLGIPGGTDYCMKCERLVTTAAFQGNVEGVLGGLVLLGLGIGAAVLVAKILDSIFE